MANQSVIAVPQTVEDPRILKRFLSRLVEEVDILLGYRADTTGALISQADLIRQATELEDALKLAKDALTQATEKLDESLAADVDKLLGRVSTLENSVAAIQVVVANFSLLKGLKLKFTVDVSNNILHTINYNINTVSSSRISTGVYRFTLLQDTFYGYGVIANSTAALTFVIADSATSEGYKVDFAEVTASTFEIRVQSITQGTGNKLQLDPYDLQPGDTITTTAMFGFPTSELPPV